jgi:ATP synthase protein I
VVSPGASESERRSVRQAGNLAQVGLTLVIATVLGLWGGYALDGWLGTSPWLTVVGLLLGIVSGFVNLFRVAGVFGAEKGGGTRGGDE